MQKEVKVVFFQPTEGHWAADVYINGERVHCGKGWKTEDGAKLEAFKVLADRVWFEGGAA